MPAWCIVIGDRVDMADGEDVCEEGVGCANGDD